jgi:flavodoxin
MNVLIVYDSVFGNTGKIAQAVGNAISSQGRHVDVVHVKNVRQETIREADLLILGSPTRGFRPTPAITKFLKHCSSDSRNSVNVAAFDTRIALHTIKSAAFRFIVKTGGYAAPAIARRLKKQGARVLVPPEGFLVTGEQGPLQAGELERAVEWATQIAAA